MMRCIVNPLCLFLLVWGIATALYLAGVGSGMFPAPGAITAASVLLNVVTFTLGYLTWTSFSRVDRDWEIPAARPGRPLAAAIAARLLRLTLAAGALALVLDLYRLDLIARHFNTTWFELATHPDLLRIRVVMFIGQDIFQTSGIVMLVSATNALFWIGFVLLGVLLYRDRNWRLYLYLAAFLGISLTLALIRMSRCETVANILYLVFAYCFTASVERSRREAPAPGLSLSPRGAGRFGIRPSYLNLLIPAAAVVLLFAANDILLHKSSAYGQPGRLQGFLFHLYWYVASPLAAFNEFATTFTGDHLWGQSTFLPLYKWLCRFHLARETELAIYGEFLLIPYATNVYTYLRTFYEDFGVLGVAIIPYILGWLTAVVQARARRSLPFLNAYLVLLLLLLLSFYNYFLASNQMYLQILFGFLLFRYELPSASLARGVRADGRDGGGGGIDVEPAGPQAM